jgi:hypothetical protein
MRCPIQGLLVWADVKTKINLSGVHPLKERGAIAQMFRAFAFLRHRKVGVSKGENGILYESAVNPFAPLLGSRTRCFANQGVNSD